MIGASKLDEQKVQEIKRLFATTMLCDGDIAEMYGVSREMINQIRSGKKWNDEKRSFVMKDQMKSYTKTITIVRGNQYSSQISPVETTQGRLFIVLHYIGDEVFQETSRVFTTEPDYELFKEEHYKFIKKVNV
jgi:hypothetical protein